MSQLVFRLHPNEGVLFVRVRIHRTLKAMRARAATLNRCGITSTTGWANVLGVCTPWHVEQIYESGRVQRDPCVAEVNLARRHCTMRVVTHELFHATMEWGRRVGVSFARVGELTCDDDMDEEERLAYVHGDLCREFVTRAEAAGLYS